MLGKFRNGKEGNIAMKIKGLLALTLCLLLVLLALLKASVPVLVLLRCRQRRPTGWAAGSRPARQRAAAAGTAQVLAAGRARATTAPLRPGR